MLVIISQVNQKNKEFACIYYIVFWDKIHCFRIFFVSKKFFKYIVLNN